MTIQKRPLGSTGIEVSSLGVGTVKFGRNEEVKYPSNFSLPTDREIQQLLDIAQTEGINLLDTAPAYGSSEQRIGRLLRNREDWVICTKVGEQFITGKSIYDFSEKHCRESIEKSLRFLNTDYIDMVLIHSDGRDEHILNSTECLRTLQDLKDAGKIRAIGMSTKTVAGGLLALESCDVLMVTYNPATTQEEIVISAAAEKSKGILIKKVFNSGHACVTEQGDGAEDSLSFVLKNNGVSSAIVGTINPDHLKDNAKIARSVMSD